MKPETRRVPTAFGQVHPRLSTKSSRSSKTPRRCPAPPRSAPESTPGTRSWLQCLYGYVVVGIHADPGGDAQRLFGDLLCRQVGMRAERARGRERVGPTRAYPDQAIVGLDDIARAGDDEGDLGVGHREERLQTAEDAVHPPVLGALDGGD